MQTLRASTFGLSAAHVSDAILDVIDSLSAAGFDAYIVGGGVRDLLLGFEPKDFDAVTNATPAQIKHVFGKRCRIIGRRFELAHVYSGRDMIEVATFRAPPTAPNTNAAGMITRDNVWGSIQQDFKRRDFTINALYYQPRKDIILDFCDAIGDVQAKRLRFLGEAQLRVEEDPVRMLRVVRFAAKLGFHLDASIQAALQPQNTKLLLDVSSHRLFDEVQKMFGGGHLAALLPLLAQHHLWHTLFGDVPVAITPFIQRAAANTDLRIAAGKSINPAFFFAVLLWQTFLKRMQHLVADGLHPSLAWTQAGVMTLSSQDKHTAIPRFSQNFIREIWEMQPRLIQPKPRQIPVLAMHPRFRAGFDFLHLREQAGDDTTDGMGQWWHDYQHLDNDSREEAIALLNRTQQRNKKQKVGSAEPKALALQRMVDEVANTALDTNAYGELQLIEPERIKPKRVRNRKPRQNIDDVAEASMLTDAGNTPLMRSTRGHNTRAPQRKRRQRDLSTVVMGPRGNAGINTGTDE